MDGEKRNQLLESYQSGYARIMDALQQYPREMWEYKPGAEDWSIHEILVHLADAEVIGYIRFCKAIAEPGAPGPGWDQPAWARQLCYQERAIEPRLELFQVLREQTTQILRELPEQQWANTMGHPTRGQITVEDLLVTYAGHVNTHLEQMRDVYQRWKATQR